MEHASTLCAIGTVGIAATGFAFGRREGGQPTTSFPRRRRSLFRSSHPSPLSRVFDITTSADRSEPATPTSIRPMTAQAPSSRPLLNAIGAGYMEEHPEENASREDTTTQTQARPRRSTNADIIPRVGEESFGEPFLSGRPSSSWRRRFSTMTPSYHGSSLSGSRPGSVSVTGSATPFFPTTPNPAPNKLVKRSTSQRVIPHPHEGQTTTRTTTNTSLLRRPATSHQRSATMRHRSSTESRSPLEPASCQYDSRDLLPTGTNNVPSQETWRPYFNSTDATVTKSDRYTSTRNGVYAPRRISSSPGDLPTLLLASAITPSNCKGPHNNCAISPISPLREIPKEHGNDVDEQSTPGVSGTIGVQKQRRSFTIGEFKGPPSASRKTSTSKGFLRQRELSAPQEHAAEELRGPKTERIRANSMRFRRRKNITDSDVFQRPHTSAQVDIKFGGELPCKTSPRARLRRLPKLDDLRVELSGEPPSNALPCDAYSRQSSMDRPCNPSESNSSPAPASVTNQRLSAAASDPASTLVGSDNDTRVFSSGEEDELDFQSDTVFDSLPTRSGTNSNSGPRGPRIETIFDRPSHSELEHENKKVTALEHLVTDVKTVDDEDGIKSDEHSAFQATDSLLPLPETYKETSIQRRDSFTSPANEKLSGRENISSMKAPASSLKILSEMEHVDDWDAILEPHLAASSPQTEPPNILQSLHPASNESTNNRRWTLFDWSEQQRNEKDTTSTSYRPSTVHGKQLADIRGGRTSARSPSAVHLRSQSVPIARDPNEPHNPSQKFGTWGLGNKGVTEDWDGDFEFDEDSDDKREEPAGGGVGVDHSSNGRGMKVPQAIMERQASVHGQFGQVQELTLLVEELKRLNIQGSSLGIINGPSNDLWKEARGIINLATLEEDEDEDKGLEVPSPSSATSDVFNLDFSSSLPTSLAREIRRSPLSERTNSSSSTPVRPRAESSVKAKLVLDTIYKQRRGHGADTQQKLAFDTQSLRDLVTRAGVVTRALKEIVRKAEGVYLTAEPGIEAYRPPFSQIFASSVDESVPPHELSPSTAKTGCNAFPADIHCVDEGTREPFTMTAAV